MGLGMSWAYDGLGMFWPQGGAIVLNHSLRRVRLIWVSCMTAVAGTRFTNPGVTMTKSSLRS